MKLAIEGVARNAKHLRCETLVAPRLAKGFPDSPLLELAEVERGAICGAGGAVHDSGAPAEHPTTHVLSANGGTIGRQRHGESFEQVLEFPDVPRERVIGEQFECLGLDAFHGTDAA